METWWEGNGNNVVLYLSGSLQPKSVLEYLVLYYIFYIFLYITHLNQILIFRLQKSGSCLHLSFIHHLYFIFANPFVTGIMVFKWANNFKQSKLYTYFFRYLSRLKYISHIVWVDLLEYCNTVVCILHFSCEPAERDMVILDDKSRKDVNNSC